MRRLLPLLALLTACVEDLPERRVLIPPPDRGIPIPPPFRPDAFRGWGGGDGDAGELDAGDAFDLGRGPDATELDHQVGDARPRDAGELDAGDGPVGDAAATGPADVGVIDATAQRDDAAVVSEWPDGRLPRCEEASCVGDEVCARWQADQGRLIFPGLVCQLRCTPDPDTPGAQGSCPEDFFCCTPGTSAAADGDTWPPFCMQTNGQFRGVCARQQP